MCPTQGAFYAFVDWTDFLGARTPSGVTLAYDEAFCRYLLNDFTDASNNHFVRDRVVPRELEIMTTDAIPADLPPRPPKMGLPSASGGRTTP